MATKVIDVFCKNGHLLFAKYKKEKQGFLMKCYINMIGEAYIGISSLANKTNVYCPRCKLRIGRIAQIHGRPSVVINHGGVKRTKT